MTYPILDLAAGGIPVAVTCRVLGFSKQAFYSWLARPVTRRDVDDAYLINAAYDIHHEFGFRLIADDLPAHGVTAGENRVARLCSQQRIWSVLSKKRGLNRQPGPPVHDDLVERQFTANRPNQVWLTDITEHRTAEGKVYLCVIKDVPFRADRRILDRLENEGVPCDVGAAQRHHAPRTPSPGGGSFRPRKPASSGPKRSCGQWPTSASSGRWAASVPAATTPPWSHSSRTRWR